MTARRDYTAADAIDALQHCNPGADRRQWVRTMAAAKDAGLSFDDVLTWSATAANFKGERDVAAAWRSIKPDGIKAGTLYHEARAAGWKPRQAGDEPRPVHRTPAPAKRAVAPARPPRWSAADVWASGEPATAAHPYVLRKAGDPEGLRICTQPVRIGGVDMAGALLVPVHALAGELVSLQCIPADGPKMNLPGHPMAGVHIVGDLDADGTAYLCEGIGQAWACWQATGCAAVVAFGWGRVRAVAGELLALHPGLSMVLVPDAGKEADAQAIAEDVGCQWVQMPADAPANFDANDYAAEHGADMLAELLEAAQAPATADHEAEDGAEDDAQAPRFRILHPADLRELPPLRWRVKGVLPAVGLAAIFGPSASGKSFLAFDLAAAIAEGREWFGYRVKAAPVLYLPLEGEAGFRLRADAWEAEHGRALADGVLLTMDPFKLTAAADVLALAAAAEPIGAEPVIIVDTLNRAAPEADENSSADMGRIIEGAKNLQRLTGGLVILVHHTGKDSSRGLRGHSSLFAALDGTIEVTRDDDRRQWRVSKSKDGEDGGGHAFKLHVHELGEDDDGDPLTSCAIRPDTSASEERRPQPPRGPNQRVVYDALLPLFRAGTHHGRAGAPPLRACIELEAGVTAGAGVLTCEESRRRERAREALTKLIAGRHLCHRDDWLWLP
ncbi:AAA family ATPase [uncultured Sphaerotilus sp.]|uniref:AAA family ATPase n=1 Tax=uncultured Sphaerotilus sp. TaxID=474984 RepID=UPI0030CA3C4E